MDTEKYKVLLHTIRTGSLSETGEALGYTPSGISRAITNLEAELGVKLLNRRRSGVVPTNECKQLLPIISRLIRTENQLEQQVSQIKGLEKGSIVIGTAYTMFYPMLSKLIYNFTRQYPNIDVSLIERTSSQLVKAVEMGTADFCIVSKRKGKYGWTPLVRDRLCVYASKNHPQAANEFFKSDDLAKEDFIEIYPHQETDNTLYFAENKIKTHVKYVTQNEGSACAMVEAGLGVTILNGIYADDMKNDLAVIPLDPPRYVDIGIAMQSDEYLSPAARRFVEFSKEEFDELRLKYEQES
jgi:DNA-binding transcriptional LysR family regulator